MLITVAFYLIAWEIIKQNRQVKLDSDKYIKELTIQLEKKVSRIPFIGRLSSCKNRGSVGEYFLAGRSMNFILVGASLFASNIGSGHFIGLSGFGASSGIAVADFEIGAVHWLMVLGWLFVPIYMKAAVFTMPQYIKMRYGGERIRVYLTCLALMLSIFTKISVDLYSGAIFLQQALNWNLYASVIALILLAAFFTVGGGLTAVIWTDFIQTVIMVVSAFILMIISFVRVGGMQQIRNLFPYALAYTTLHNTTECGVPNEYYFSLIRPFDADLPWFGILFGHGVMCIWYWCSDQVIVQRALAAKNLTHARAGCLVAGILKLLPLFLIVFPGMIARILFPDEIGCADPDVCYQVCRSRNGCSDIAYPLLVLRLMPNAIRGLTLACMIAALMSSLTSIFNSSSTIFTIDIWQRFRQNAHDWELMIVGRVFVMFLVGISILWIPVIRAAQGARLFDYIQAVSSFLAPPVAACYLLGILWKRINEEISGLTIFDLDNPEKAIEIPTRPGCDSVGIVFYLKTAFVWICGLEKPDKLDGQSTCSDSHPHDNTSNRRNSTSIREEHVSSWHKECSYVAIIMLALSAFVWAFFTDYRIRLN
ncbi:unnamed protein product [Rotaria sp. Silwood1]|nr:unnamed protein product [Rotaria sp. Silwood1]